MSVATRLQSLQQSIEASTQPTDVGVAGPTPGDMARAFRSVRRDPLSFLTEVSARYGERGPAASAVLCAELRPKSLGETVRLAVRDFRHRDEPRRSTRGDGAGDAA